jgi:hypothetical protein
VLHPKLSAAAFSPARIVPYLPLFLPLVLFFYTLNTFPYPSSEAIYSDLTLSHYPNASYLRRSIVEEGRIPLWSEGILSGVPFAADPLSGLWYPPGWLALLFPLPLGFNLLIALHLVWGGLGMYLLLRAEEMSYQSALFGALAFAWLPKLFAHFGAGHLTLLYAVPWTPWLLWAAARGSREENPPLQPTATAEATFRNDVNRFGVVLGLETPRWPYWEALFLALIFLADVRWSVYAGALWLAYRLAHGHESMWRRAASFVGQSILAALLAAPMALPLLEFTRLSSRASLGEQDVLAFSLPPIRLLGLIFPDYGGFHEYMVYPGQVVLALSLLAAVGMASDKGKRFWLWSALAALILSLGSYLPPLALLARLPLLDWLRVPARANFITGLCLAALAARAVEWLVEENVSERLKSSLRDARKAEKDQQKNAKPRARRAGLALAALVAFSLSMTASVAIFTSSLPTNFAWGAAFCLASAAWIGLRLAGRITVRPWLVGLAILCLMDLGRMDLSLFAPRSAKMVLAEADELAEYLAGTPGLFRVYSPSYSLPQQTAALYGLQQADGVDPLQLQSYVDFMKAASGVPWSGYSVTVPPFASGQPAVDNAPYQPDPERLGLLNVRYVAAAFDLDLDGLALLKRFGDTRLYENEEAHLRAWVYPQDSRIGSPLRDVDQITWSPECIEIAASGPGLLVLSEVAYPGWRAWVDGSPAQVETVHELLRGVPLAEGDHQVVFAFRPLSLYLGLGLCVCAIVYLGGSAFFHQKRLEGQLQDGEKR